MRGVTIVHKTFNRELARTLKRGGIAVIPTDTIYGVVGSARNKKTVARIYRVRRRNSKKPFIILISSLRDLSRFGVRIGKETQKLLRQFWPGKVSVILPCRSKKFNYLHRGTNTLAFRLPAKKSLKNLLRRTGPLVAPSANLEGTPPARTISEAKSYFKNRVEMYIDRGSIRSHASALVDITKGLPTILRKGGR